MKDIQELSAEITEDITQLRSANTALDRFGIELDEPEAGTVELGIQIPRAAVHERLREFGDELRKLSRILAVFHEVTHGDRPDVKLKTIASSEFSVLCLLDWETAKLIAKSLADLIEGYKIVLKLKDQIQGLRDTGVPEEHLKPVIDHANNAMKTTVTAVSEEIITRFPNGKVQEHRTKELRIEIEQALGELGTRIDKGFSFEIRPGTPVPLTSEEASDSSASARAEINRQDFAAISALKTTLEFLKNDGNPILSLPGLPSAEDGEKKKAAKG